jgi:hypothetical protein
MPAPTPPSVKPVVFPQPLARGRRAWLLMFPVAVGLVVAGWWPSADSGPSEEAVVVDRAPLASIPPEPPEPTTVVVPDSSSSEPAPPTTPPATVRGDAPSEAPPRTGPPPAPRKGIGWLAVSSMPWGEVIVDDRRVGPSPQTAIPLSPGEHEVRIIRPGFMAYVGKVRIEAGRTARVTRIVLSEATGR